MSTTPHKAKCEPVGIQSEDIPDVWPRYKPLIQKALDRGSGYSITDIADGLECQDMQLWVWGLEAALVTSIQNDEKVRWCLLLACGGKDMDQWFPYLPGLEDWAREQGCDEMRVYGRLGWVRHLRPSGYSFDWVKLRKEL